MNLQVTPKTDGYGIEVEPLDGVVTVRHNGVLLASSTNAKVMYETRLPPAIYFPPEDVLVPLSDPTDLQTFCPFKGTASYRDILLDKAPIQNGIWTYLDALPESRGIQRHVGFVPNDDTEFDLGGNKLRSDSGGNISGPLINWLLREAGYLPTPEAFTAALAEKMAEHGIALSRLAVMAWSLHPLIAGKNYIWVKSTGEVNTRAPTYEIHSHPAFQNSPLRHVSNGLGGVRQRLDAEEYALSFPIMEDLRKEGATDYVAMPLRFSSGRINVLTLTSDHPNGFTTANLGLVFECSLIIARYYEVFMQRENAQSLLETYVGKRTGARVLGGEIRRGDGDEIDAAIMFCDLRNSTGLEQQLGRRAYIGLLNEFFETTSNIIDAHGGEVLKFIGDAVLAVFPAGTEAEKAKRQALASAREIVAHLAALNHGKGHACECAIGIAFGEVTYGNVGSRERLDFTVIGRAANIAGRLSDYGKSQEYAIVATADITEPGCAATPLGPISLHNVSEPVECFVVAPAM
jgi:adenylate cyclase